MKITPEILVERIKATKRQLEAKEQDAKEIVDYIDEYGDTTGDHEIALSDIEHEESVLREKLEAEQALFAILRDGAFDDSGYCNYCGNLSWSGEQPCHRCQKVSSSKIKDR